jgi:hypothetical protein
MSGKHGWGDTVLGWFVEKEPRGDDEAGAGEPAGDDADALIRKYAGGAPGAAAVEVPASAVSAAVAADGSFDFGPVFESAGIAAEERDRVATAQELLRSLPAETPAAVKRQIVEASLRAFGVPTERIIQAAVHEIGALEGFIRAGESDALKVTAEGQQRIAQLEEEIAQVKRVMDEAVAGQAERGRAANGEKLRIQQVLEFFGQEVVAQAVADSAPPRGRRA